MSSNIEDEMYYGQYEGGALDSVKTAIGDNALIVLVIMIVMAVIIVFLLVSYVFTTAGKEGMLASGSAKARLSNDQGWYEGYEDPTAMCNAKRCSNADVSKLPTISKSPWQAYVTKDRIMDSSAPMGGAPNQEGFSDRELLARLQTGH